jgi:MscS family membrane protein
MERSLLKQRIRFGWIVAVLVMWAVVAAGQQPAGLPATPAAAPSAPAQETDPIGRSTPRGTVSGFIRAVNRNDFEAAARYMQLSDRQAARAEELTREFKGLLNCCFSQPLAAINDTPSGDLEDSLPLDRERVGPLKILDQKVDIILVRVTRPDGSIWLISEETVARVPALFGLIEQSWVDRVMPEALKEHEFFGISLAYWVAWIGSLGIPLLVLEVLSRLIRWISLKIVKTPAKRSRVMDWYAASSRPLILVLTVAAHTLLLTWLGFTLHFRLVDLRLVLVVQIVLLAWLLRRVVTIGFKQVRLMLKLRNQNDTVSLVLLGERLLNVFIIIGAIFALLTVAGVDTKTALAGLGIGGIAVAFGAQKTIENLLGGILLISDKALAIGDECFISGRQGTIEDITLRSVRLRTLDQTLLSIPAGVLSQANIENFALRRKMLMQTKLRLQYGTATGQIQTIQEEIQELLAKHPKVEAGTFWVRLTDFGERAIELDLFAYIPTVDRQEFLSVREDLLLQITQIVESAGSSFAIPLVSVASQGQNTPSQSSGGTA